MGISVNKNVRNPALNVHRTMPLSTLMLIHVPHLLAGPHQDPAPLLPPGTTGTASNSMTWG